MPGTLVHGHACDVSAFKKDLTPIRCNHAHDHAKTRGLACPISAEQAHNTTLINGHGDPIDYSTA